jgi:uncharacterized membrane protein (UPF0127 family)
MYNTVEQVEKIGDEVQSPIDYRLSSIVVTNVTRNTVLADNARRAEGFFARGCGLMFTTLLPEGGGLIIEPCNSIHMFFMRYPLDVIFIDKSGQVLFMYEAIKPWRVGRLVRGARTAIELPAGSINGSQTAVGDILTLRPQNTI